MGNMKIVEAEGNNYDIGFQIGKQTKKEIRLRLKSISNKFSPKQNKIYKELLEKIQKKYPQYLEELKGMADGAQVEFSKLARLNLPEIDDILEKKKENIDGCTTLVMKRKNRTLIAHNEDGGKKSDIFLARITLKNNFKILAICYYGILPGFSTSINSAGLFIACDMLDSKNARIGIPKRIITRRAIESKNLKEFKKVILQKDKAQSQNYIIFEKNKTFDIEAGVKEFSITEIKNKFAHTNHFLSEKMKKEENDTDPKSGSRYRYKTATEMMKKVKEKNQMKKILSSHKNKPYSICAHKKDENLTLGVCIYDSKIPKSFEVGYGNTCKAKLKRYFIQDKN